MFARLGRLTYVHRRLVAAAWLVVLLAGFAVGGAVFDRLDGLSTGRPELVARVDGAPVADTAIRRAVTSAAADVRRMTGVAKVADHHSSGSARLVVRFREDLTDEQLDQALDTVQGRLRAIRAGTVTIGGDLIAERERRERAERDLRRGLGIALPLALVVLGALPGGFVAGLIPVVIAMAGVAGGLLLLLAGTFATDVSIVAVQAVAMFGFGLGAGAGLYAVRRFREERADGADVATAVEHTTATAGRTIAFSGLAVAIACGGLLAPFRGLGLAGLSVALVTAATAVTLLPALLGLWGSGISPATGAS